jgi:hypothetical protein
MDTYDPYEAAAVQYDDWTGTVAGDRVEFDRFEKLLGIDNEKWRVLVIEIISGGGHQTLIAYGVSKVSGFSDLQEIVDDGRTIVLTSIKTLDYRISGHVDTNPPAPPIMPVESATDFLAYGFKRFHLKLVSKSLPKDAKFETTTYIDTDGNEG